MWHVNTSTGQIWDTKGANVIGNRWKLCKNKKQAIEEAAGILSRKLDKILQGISDLGTHTSTGLGYPARSLKKLIEAQMGAAKPKAKATTPRKKSAKKKTAAPLPAEPTKQPGTSGKYNVLPD